MQMDILMHKIAKKYRHNSRVALNSQRTEDYKTGILIKELEDVVDPLPEDAPFFVKDY